jgi:hypothetical protein
MSWLTDLLARRHRSSTREYHVVLPDGTERTFDLARTATGHDLVEVSLLSMSVPGVYHFMFGLTIPSKDDHDVSVSSCDNFTTNFHNSTESG